VFLATCYKEIEAVSTDPEKDLGMKGREDTAKGKMKQTAGKVQSKVGEIAGNKEMEIKGDAKQAEGAVQAAKGKAERKVDDTLDHPEANM
jgi:uncharacterized protein YjbJ (UPF0337 family)